MGQVEDATQNKDFNITQVFPTNSDPGKYERLRKKYLYDKGPRTLVNDLQSIWHRFRAVDKRIAELEDRVKELDGISMSRHIARPPNIVEYHIDRFILDDESG